MRPGTNPSRPFNGRVLGAVCLALLASAPALWLYLLPPEVLAALNRIADLNVHNSLLLHFERREFERPNDDLRVIAIDERSLHLLGQFPWRRSLHAHLLRRLAAAGAKTVAFNVFFVDPAADRSQDAQFAAALNLVPTVLAYPLENAQRVPPIAATLSGHGAYLGFNSVDEPAGWLIGEWLTIGSPKKPLDSLQATALRLYTGKAFRREGTIEYFGARAIALDARGHLLLLPVPVREAIDSDGLPFASVPFARSMSYVDALRANSANLRRFVAGKLVVIGPSAAGFDTMASTPEGRILTFFANLRIIDQLLTGRFIEPAPAWLDGLLIAGGALLIALALTVFEPRAAVLAVVGILVGYALLDTVLYVTHYILDDLIHVELAMVLAALVCTPFAIRSRRSAPEVRR